MDLRRSRWYKPGQLAFHRNHSYYQLLPWLAQFKGHAVGPGVQAPDRVGKNK
jgi:hypothetical protein